ncbi:hypothetical protein CCP3SC1AL1_2110003 [Gammaproteobacteria bacterium]
MYIVLQKDLAETMELEVEVNPTDERNKKRITQPVVPGSQRQMVEAIYEGEILL